MKKWLCLLLTCLPLQLWAAQDIYQFKSTEQRARFDSLTTELRCLVCQNQNIAESNAPLAADLRTQIYQKMQQGETDRDIIQYLVARYGDFILYRPPFTVTTLGLWLGPFAFLLLGLGYLLFYVATKQREQS